MMTPVIAKCGQLHWFFHPSFLYLTGILILDYGDQNQKATRERRGLKNRFCTYKLKGSIGILAGTMRDYLKEEMKEQKH